MPERRSQPSRLCFEAKRIAGPKRVARHAFSLVELVVVVVIIGIIAAIAAPRFSSATSTALATSIQSNVAAVTRAMAHYEAEHGEYPGYTPGTGVPDGAIFVDQLLKFSAEDGSVSGTRGFPRIYGPYLRSPFPTNPLNKLDTVKTKTLPTDPLAPDSSGWVAVLSTGEFGINSTETELEDLGLEGDVVKGLVK